VFLQHPVGEWLADPPASRRTCPVCQVEAAGPRSAQTPW
jgi:hypothetical protein